jgi:hypothetical protein
MMQKFGQIVNLEELEMVTANEQLEELKEKFRQHEALYTREIQKWYVSKRGV